MLFDEDLGLRVGLVSHTPAPLQEQQRKVHCTVLLPRRTEKLKDNAKP